ncbi:uncharacterized protein TRIADDRAFT_31681, partial [Trichoplax adhaerens]
EEHGKPLFGVHFNYSYSHPDDSKIFASVGANKVSIYQCTDDGRIKLLQAYTDPDPEEDFYTCAWSYLHNTSELILAIAGARGVIRIINAATTVCIKCYPGQGNAINELKFHPLDPNILASVGKDHLIHLWNIKNDTCIAIFGGIDGHRDEVLSVDFDILGKKIISSGMDHSIKMWTLESEILEETIKKSYEYNPVTADKSFKILYVDEPQFSTRDIHRNYIDCVRWFGNLILSKSCENSIVCWQPTCLTEKLNPNIKKERNCFERSRFDYNQCDIWYLRFCLDYQQKTLAVGNQVGKVFLWDLENENLSQHRAVVLSHPKCSAAIRQIAISRDGSCLVHACDDGTIWRWDKKM